MQRSGRILIVLGMVLGILAFAAAALALSNTGRASTTAGIKLTKVVVAQQNIAMRSPIVAAAVTLADWPEDSVPADVFKDVSLVVDKLATTPIVQGQVIVPSMLVDKSIEETRKGLGSTASYIVPSGKVLVDFPISALSGVSYALREGDTVNVLTCFELEPSRTQTGGAAGKRVVCQTTLQDIEILRVGTWLAPLPAEGVPQQVATTREPAHVTFLVSHQDALVLMFLRETGTEVQLALRAAGDHQVVTTQPVVIEYIEQRFNYGGSLAPLR